MASDPTIFSPKPHLLRSEHRHPVCFVTATMDPPKPITRFIAPSNPEHVRHARRTGESGDYQTTREVHKAKGEDEDAGSRSGRSSSSTTDRLVGLAGAIATMARLVQSVILLCCPEVQ